MRVLSFNWLIVSAIVFGSMRLSATSIVIIRTPKHIVVAADSLWSHHRGKEQLPPRIECKMKRIGHIYFTASTTDVDAREMEYLAWEAMKSSQSVGEAADHLMLKSKEMAARTAAHESQSILDMCWGHSCAEALFFGVESGVPTMVLIKFQQAGNSRQSLKLVPHKFSCPGDCPKEPEILLALGQREEIERLKQHDPTFLQRNTDVDAARKLVEIEEKAKPEYVGGPIDLLVLDAAGAHWSPAEGGTCSADERAKPIR